MRYLFMFFFITSLMADNKISTHSLQLENELLIYNAVVGSLPSTDQTGDAKGEIHYIAYFKEERGRPLTFLFNGGPGSSSIWLHMCAVGPRRILSAEEGQSVSPPYKLIDNDETLLDMTDLVFVDPVGTGMSRAKTPEDEKLFYDSLGDVQSLAHFIRDFLTINKRWNCPIYLAGESYGTMRCCGLADYLQSHFGIYLNGLILISCAIDYQTFVFDSDNLLPYPLILPTYAATAWYHGRYRPGASLEEIVDESRNFAYETYTPALMRSGLLSHQEREELYAELVKLTGLPLNVVRRAQGRIDDYTFTFEFFPEEKRMLGCYDTRLTGPYIESHLAFSHEPTITSVGGIVSGAFHNYLQAELDSPISYTLFSDEVNFQWNYKSYNDFGYPNFMEGLRNSLVINPELKVFVGMGYFDGVTPFAAAEYCLNHLNLPNFSTPFIQQEYYEGGHMYYLNPAARKKFKRDLIRFYQQ